MRHYFINITAVLFLIIQISNPVFAVDISDAYSIELIDETGQRTSINDYNGYYRLVFFGYTFCPDICPMTLFNVGAALKSLGPLAEKTRVLFISIDPKRDTPEILAKYTDAFHKAVIGLTGDYENILQLTRGFHTTFGYSIRVDNQERPLSREEYATISSEANYTPYHSSQIYLLDTEGELVDIIGYGSVPKQIADKIREHINGKS